MEKSGKGVARGPAQRAAVTSQLLSVVRERYGLESESDSGKDLGGSSNLNLLIGGASGKGGRCVVRVYRPWVTVARLEAIQLARR